MTKLEVVIQVGPEQQQTWLNLMRFTDAGDRLLLETVFKNALTNPFIRLTLGEFR